MAGCAPGSGRINPPILVKCPSALVTSVILACSEMLKQVDSIMRSHVRT